MNSIWVATGEFYDGTHFVTKGLPTNDFTGTLVEREIVVCFHGMKLYHVVWNYLSDYILEKAPNKYIVVQFDQMGRGFSEPSRNGKYTDKEYLSLLSGFLAYLRDTYLPAKGIRSKSNLKFHFIGHSFGGCLASLFTAEHPDFVKSLTLLAPAGLLNFFPHGLIQIAPLLRAVMRGKLEKRENQLKSWKDDFYHHSDKYLAIENQYIAELTQMYDNNPDAFESFFATFSTFPMIDISKQLKTIREMEHFPIFLLWADKDEAVSFEVSYPKWLKIFRDSSEGKNKTRFETKVYPDGKHGFFLEYHDQVNSDILKFLNENS
jgi:pimeloyl-ACP methyl ester carboxylesterase